MNCNNFHNVTTNLNNFSLNLKTALQQFCFRFVTIKRIFINFILKGFRWEATYITQSTSV